MNRNDDFHTHGHGRNQSNANDEEELLDAILLTPKSLSSSSPLLERVDQDDAMMEESPPKKLKLSPPPLIQQHAFVDRLVDFHSSDSTLSLPSLDREDCERSFHLVQRRDGAANARNHRPAPQLSLRRRTSSEPDMGISRRDTELALPSLQPRIREWSAAGMDMPPVQPRQRSVSYDVPSVWYEVNVNDHDMEESDSTDSDVLRDMSN